jgi:hypothetical protein
MEIDSRVITIAEVLLLACSLLAIGYIVGSHFTDKFWHKWFAEDGTLDPLADNYLQSLKNATMDSIQYVYLVDKFGGKVSHNTQPVRWVERGPRTILMSSDVLFRGPPDAAVTGWRGCCDPQGDCGKDDHGHVGADFAEHEDIRFNPSGILILDAESTAITFTLNR